MQSGVDWIKWVVLIDGIGLNIERFMYISIVLETLRAKELLSIRCLELSATFETLLFLHC